MAEAATGAEKPQLVDVDKLRAEIEAQKGEAYNFTYANGRRYASSEMGHYYLPNDEPEIQRLNDQHRIFMQVNGGKLHHCPLTRKGGLKILDVGCGSGIWCIQMAEDYPDASINGMDISPIQPENKPDCVEWITHDMEKEWPFPDNHFDFIHLSLVQGNVVDYPAMMQKIVRHLAPGGWVEHQEWGLSSQFIYDDQGQKLSYQSEPINSIPMFCRYGRLMGEAGEKRGRSLKLGPNLQSMQTDAGLQDVDGHMYEIPIGTWPEDEQQRLIGGQVMLNGLQGMDGFVFTLWTRVLGWSEDDTRKWIEEVKEELRDDSMRKVQPLWVAWGRKEMGV